MLISAIPSNKQRHNLTDYNETVVFPEPEELKMSRAHRVKANGKVITRNEHLTLQPNPARDYMVVSYHVTAGHSSSLVLSDATGKQLEVISIKPVTNQKVISLARYANGNYVLTLLVDGRALDSAKLTISH